MSNFKDNDFSSSGTLASVVPDYEPRAAQAELAEAVAEVMDQGGMLIAEAGTGVGKSLAYLMPGLRRAMEGGKSILISTATLTLQAQLLQKDIPLAFEALGISPEDSADKVAQAMGRSNYFCRLRLEQALGVEAGLLVEDAHTKTLKQLDTWGRRERETVRDRLPFPVDANLWEKTCVDAFGCLGQQCPHARDCFFLKDREHLRQASVVVANHALVLSDVVARRERSAILPDTEIAVFDEAHHLERMASEHLGIRLGAWEMEMAFSPVLEAKSGKGLCLRLGAPEGLASLIRDARFIADTLFDDAARQLGLTPGQKAVEVAAGSFQDALSGVLLDAAKSLERASEGVSDEILAAESRAAAARLSRCADDLRAWMGQSDPSHVYWLEPRGRRSEVVFRSAPLDAGAALAADLYPRFKSVIFSSATLATHQGLSFARKRLGLDESTRELVLGSPFDYQKQVELHLTRTIADPRKDEAGYFDGLELAIRQALLGSSGRAFVLFTSFRHLQELSGRLEEWIEEQGWLFLKQDAKSSKDRLLREFRNHGAAVLFGATSFWEGVDVPGEALSCVILCRLPFSVPDTPLEKARARAVEQGGGTPFKDLSLPEAVLRLKQGFGRLIRHGDDQGWIHVLDPRVLNASYGKAFLKALPPCRIVIDGVQQET